MLRSPDVVIIARDPQSGEFGKFYFLKKCGHNLKTLLVAAVTDELCGLVNPITYVACCYLKSDVYLPETWLVTLTLFAF